MYAFQYLALYQKPSESNVSNSQGRNLGHSVIPARTSGLSSTEGMVREKAVKFTASLINTNDNSSNRLLTTFTNL